MNTVMIRFRLVSFFLALVAPCGFCAAQTKRLDSLKAAVRTAGNAKEKLTAFKTLAQQSHSLNNDTMLRYALAAKQLAQGLGDGETEGFAEAAIAFSFAGKKRLDTALRIVEVRLQKTKPGDGELYLLLLLDHSRLLYRNNQYKEALQALFFTLNAAEKAGNPRYQVMAKTGIGWLQLDMKQYDDALQWFYRALHTPGGEGYLDEYTALYSNIATAYEALGRTDSALHYVRKAIDKGRQSDRLDFLATSLRIYADILMQQKQFRGAEDALKEMVEIRKNSDGSFFVNYDMSLLAKLYAKTGQTAKGMALCKAVIDSARKSGITTQLYLMYDALADNYKAHGDYKAYGETLEQSHAMQDSLQTLNTGQLIAALQGQNELQKKETVIVRQQLDIVQKKMLLYGLLALLLFAAVLTVTLFKQYGRRQRLKLQGMQEEEKRAAEIAVQKAEEAERKRIATDLHDSLGAYAASIASNIHRLEASGPIKGNGVLAELRTNSQAIVSQLSDTIWVLKKDALLLTSISDRIKVFIQRISPSYPYVIIDVFEGIETDHLLPPAQAFHLFQIVKEAVSNALRHSGCTQIAISLHAAGGWHVSITDNGRGIYNGRRLAGGGNGLPNMKQRAAESGWKIEWQTNTPVGTKVMIEPN